MRPESLRVVRVAGRARGLQGKEGMDVVKSKWALALVVAFVVLSMVAVGCAKKADTSNATGTVEPVTVKIGMGAPLTAGAVALGKGMERGTQLAIDQANQSQEAKDLKLTFEMVPGDDQGDPKTGVTVANTFASTPGLIGVMGHLNSGVSIPASKVYNQNNLVQISPASTNPALTEQGLNNVFRVCTIDTVQGSFAADAAFKDLGFKNAFVIDDSTPYGEGLAKFFAEAFKTDGGSIAGQEKTTDKDTDFKALVTKIKASSADLIYYGGIYNAGALLAKQAKEAGIKAPFMSGDGMYDAEFIKLAGAANAEGAFATSVGKPLDLLPKGQEFKAAFEAKFPGETIAAYDAYAYDAANVIIAATIKAAGTVGTDQITAVAGKKAIIAAVAATNTEGVTGTISFDQKGDTTNKAITLYTVKGGAWVPWTK
jgi:branched-chain amino acid transport system substrate-binding protein